MHKVIISKAMTRTSTIEQDGGVQASGELAGAGCHWCRHEQSKWRASVDCLHRRGCLVSSERFYGKACRIPCVIPHHDALAIDVSC